MPPLAPVTRARLVPALGVEDHRGAAVEQRLPGGRDGKAVEHLVGIAGQAFGLDQQVGGLVVQAQGVADAARAGQIALTGRLAAVGEQGAMQGHGLGGVLADAGGHAWLRIIAQRVVGAAMAAGGALDGRGVPVAHRVEQAHVALVGNAGGNGGAV